MRIFCSFWPDFWARPGAPDGGFAKAVQLLPDLNTTENYAGAFTVALEAEDE